MDILGLLTPETEVCGVELRIQNFDSWVSKKGKVFPLQARCGPEGG